MIEDAIETVLEAMREGRTVKFGYHQDGAIKARIVDPSRLNGLLFLGWCCHRQEFRQFYLTKMVAPAMGPRIEDLHEGPREPEVIA